MSALLSQYPKFQAVDNTGAPLPFALLYSYAAGTTTPLSTCTDASGSVFNPNPTQCNSGGPADIWLTSGLSYKFVLEDQFGAMQWTVDNIVAQGGVNTLQLANTSGSANGAGMVGFNPAISYPSMTVGSELNAIETEIAGLQSTSLVVLTTAGTSPAFTVTPSPAISGLVAGQCFRILFNDNAANPTLNISGLGAKAVTTFNALGIVVNAVVTNGLVVDVMYDGTEFVLLNRTLDVNLPAYRGLSVYATGTNAVINISADVVSVAGLNGEGYVQTGLSGTLNTGSSGLNGLDTGTLAPGAWYNHFIIYNPTTQTWGTIASVNAAPTLPTGYTHYFRSGSFRTDSSSHFPLAFVQVGNKVQYRVTAASNLLVLPQMATGTTSGYTTISTGAFIPSTAISIGLQLAGPVNATHASVAMNPVQTSYLTWAAPFPSLVIASTALLNAVECGWFPIETGDVYYESTGSTVYLSCLGFEDAI